jgi:NAD(P)-dependent dehydrogenase (short-subunit alcohol dehydrogenase family)
MKHVFLTGASSGIGLATTQALLDRGHEVWGTSRKIEHLPQHRHFHPVQLDLRNSHEIDGAFMHALREAGHIDVLINNAGSGHFGPAEFISAEEMADQFEILVLAQIRLLQLALVHMRERDSGLIVNVTSLASRLPVPFMAAYNAAKAAMASFTMSLQLELASSHVRIVDLQPGDISTEFNDRVKHQQPPPLYRAQMATAWEIVEKNMKAAPKPEAVGRALLQLISMKNPPPRITVGDLFQTKTAPLIFRFLPQRVRIWGLKRYYGL